MVKIPSWLHFKFKDLSNEYSRAQIRVKTKKLWPRQVGEEKPVAVQKISRGQELGRDQKHVATRNMSRPETCRDQEIVSRLACCVATKNAAET